MKKILAIFDSIPLPIFAIAAIFMSVAPYPAKPMPHLIEKVMMLMDGTLVQGIDIFDLFWHSLFPVLLIVKIMRGVKIR